MSITKLNLVDEKGGAVERTIGIAVAAAFNACVHRFRRMDDAVLANFAEAVATSMNSRSSEIGAVGNYARVAMNGKVFEWMRSHPGKEIGVEKPGELERLAGAAVDQSFEDAEKKILFSQIKMQLSQRERHILFLMNRGMGPREIGSQLGITYNAASKAMQRVRERMASLLVIRRNNSKPVK